MALHGVICVNHKEIGDWQAVRDHPAESKSKDNREAYIYKCKVSRWTEAGERINDNFEVQHWYADGAMELASKVLRQAAMRGVP